MLKILPRSQLFFVVGQKAPFRCSAKFLRYKSDDGQKNVPPPGKKVEQGPPPPPKIDNDLNIDLDELNKKLEESLEESKAGKITDVDKTFMNFNAQRNKMAHQKSGIFTWRFTTITLVFLGMTTAVIYYFRKLRRDEIERNRKRMIGKARIGGEWELMNVDGKMMSSKDFHGNWLLIYFGFTNCPDICPEEMEKMVDVVDLLQKDRDPIPIVPIFISVDPTRDTPERIRKYCSEFSPKLLGFTGDNDQINKVTKAFRVYRSEGPKMAEDDYIVDHTVIMYLIAPDGEFQDYFGQNRRSSEIADAIRTKSLKYQFERNKLKSAWF